MHRLNGVEHYGSRSRRGENRTYLLRHMQTLAHTCHDNKPALVKNTLQQLDGGGKGCTKGIAGLGETCDFNVEDLLRSYYSL